MTASPMPTRAELVRALEQAADLLEIAGADEFRARAYRAAARSLEDLEEETPALAARAFGGIPKVGKGLAAELGTFAQSGRFDPLQTLLAELPPGVPALLGVRGLGPKKIRALWQAGFDSPERLRDGAASGAVAALSGFGPKSAATILENVTFLLAARERWSLGRAERVAGELAQALDGLSPRPAGDLRRGLETVGPLALTVTADAPAVLARLPGLGLPGLGLREVPGEPLLEGEWEGRRVQVGYAPAGARGALDLVLGGSEPYQAAVRQTAREAGFDLGPRGLRRGEEWLPVPDEAALEAALGFALRPPEYREPEHDAVWTELPPPAELLSTADLRGMLHTHSRWSDGAATVEQMARAALDQGYEYLGTADHSQAAAYAGGLSPERLRDQLREVRELQRAGLPLVAGSEVDILEDGSLDYPDDLLAELDYVVASVHSHFSLDPERQTERLVRAASHPLVTILGHPTGRLLLRRPGYACDLGAVLAACEARGTVVEINANPARLDLDWREALRWRGLTYAVNTDAHHPGGLGDARYGVAAARKAGLTPGQVVNTLSREDFLAFVARQRAARG